MNPHDDLPLFAWRPPACAVLPFPMVARVGKIRRAADVLHGASAKAARAYWRQITEPVSRQLREAGVAPDVVETELEAFRLAIGAELARRSCRALSVDHDGGAA